MVAMKRYWDDERLRSLVKGSRRNELEKVVGNDSQALCL